VRDVPFCPGAWLPELLCAYYSCLVWQLSVVDVIFSSSYLN